VYRLHSSGFQLSGMFHCVVCNVTCPMIRTYVVPSFLMVGRPLTTVILLDPQCMKMKVLIGMWQLPCCTAKCLRIPEC
jgi:hypothetical protein